MNKVFTHITAALLALLVLASGCTHRTNPVAGKSVGATTSTVASPRPTASATSSLSASRTSPTSVTPLPRSTDCNPIQLRYPVGNDPAKSFISANIDPGRDFGPSCPALAPGVDCSLPLAGAWRLVESTQGAIIVELWEDDTKTPVRHQYKPVPNSGRFNDSTRIRYTPHKGVKVVTIDFLLLDETTRVVASTPSTVMRLPACDPTADR